MFDGEFLFFELILNVLFLMGGFWADVEIGVDESVVPVVDAEVFEWEFVDVWLTGSNGVLSAEVDDEFEHFGELL